MSDDEKDDLIKSLQKSLDLKDECNMILLRVIESNQKVIDSLLFTNKENS